MFAVGVAVNGGVVVRFETDVGDFWHFSTDGSGDDAIKNFMIQSIPIVFFRFERF